MACKMEEIVLKLQEIMKGVSFMMNCVNCKSDSLAPDMLIR